MQEHVKRGHVELFTCISVLDTCCASFFRRWRINRRHGVKWTEALSLEDSQQLLSQTLLFIGHRHNLLNHPGWPHGLRVFMKLDNTSLSTLKL